MSASAGAGRLLWLALRRDRLRLPIWVGGLGALLTFQAAANAEEFPAAADRTAAAALLAANPALRMLRGGASDTSLGALVMSDAFWILTVVVALMSALTVVRHTRENEETGRGELVGAAPVGTHADLVAALAIACIANFALAAILAAALAINGLPLDGALAAGMSIGAIGVAFAGLAAVAVQLTDSARTAAGLSAAAVGVAYLLRGAGDAFGSVAPDGVRVTAAWPSWLSPIGWGQQVRAFDDNAWWLLGLPLALFVATGVVASILRARRDFDAGMLPTRPGPASAGPTLLSPIGLAWRLQRGLLFGWGVGAVAAGALFGSVGEQVTLLEDNPAFVETLTKLGGAGALIDTFFAAVMALAAGVVAAYPVLALLRMRAEEADGRLEPLLATSVGRARWATSHIALAAAGSIGLMALVGASAGLAYGLAAGDVGARLASLTWAALVHMPAVLAVADLVIAVFGWLPRLTDGLAWTALVAVLVLGPLGEILGLPQAARNLSPFSHIPPVPVVDATAAPLLVLLAFAAGLAAAGIIGLERRNLVLPA